MAQKKRKTKKKARVYDNKNRTQQAVENRQNIITTYIDLLVAKRGQEISLQELALKSGISLRTLFRFFGDKKSLSEELEKYLQQYLMAATENLKLMSYEDYAAFLFRVFDKYENLLLAYLYTNFGQNSRVLLRKKFTKLLLQKLEDQIKVDVSPLQKRRLYLIVTLINANIWSDLRDSFSVSGEDMAESIKWALKTLTQNIDS